MVLAYLAMVGSGGRTIPRRKGTIFLVVNSCNQGSPEHILHPRACISNWCPRRKGSVCVLKEAQGIGCGSQVHKHMGAIRFLCSGPPGVQRRGAVSLGEAWGPSNMARRADFWLEPCMVSWD